MLRSLCSLPLLWSLSVYADTIQWNFYPQYYDSSLQFYEYEVECDGHRKIYPTSVTSVDVSNVVPVTGTYQCKVTGRFTGLGESVTKWITKSVNMGILPSPIPPSIF